MAVQIDKGFSLTNHQHSEREMFTEDVHARLDPAEEYHCSSKLYPSTAFAQLSGLALLQASADLQFRSRHAWRRNLNKKVVALDRGTPITQAFGDVVKRRRSETEFNGRPTDLKAVASLLDASNGILDRSDPLRSGRTAPSGGGLYPIDLYVYALSVNGLTAGFHYYNPLDHSLVAVAGAEGIHDDLFVMPLGGATFVVILAAAFWRTRFKYGQRGYRFALLEAGHIAQNFVLAATALGVGSFPCGSTYDDRIDQLLGLDGVTEGFVYAVVAGNPKN